MKDQTKIEVRVTRSHRFRATILEPDSLIPYEVTVGGKAWDDGKGRKYAPIIFRKIQKMMTKLSSEYERANLR